MAKATNNTIATLVTTALNAASAYGTAVTGLRAACNVQLKGTMSPVEVRGLLLTPVAGFYGVTLVLKTRGEGYTLDTNAKGFEAAKKALQRLTADIVGKTAPSVEGVEVPTELMVLARKLVKAGMAYENAGRLIAQAIAQAKAE